METAYDWITVGLFAGLIVLFLQRSKAEEPTDSLWQYLCAALGCAVANYLGNHGQDLLAISLIIGTVAFVFVVLKPFPVNQKPR